MVGLEGVRGNVNRSRFASGFVWHQYFDNVVFAVDETLLRALVGRKKGGVYARIVDVRRFDCPSRDFCILAILRAAVIFFRQIAKINLTHCKQCSNFAKYETGRVKA